MSEDIIERPLGVYKELYAEPEDIGARLARAVSDELRVLGSIVLAFVLVIGSAMVLRTFATVLNPDVAHAGDIYDVEERSQGLPLTILHSVLGIETAHAASNHAAELVGEIPSIEMMPYSEKTIDLKFTNVGTGAWVNSGKNYSSLYTDPSTRKSLFSYHGWYGMGQPTLMVEDRVEPGEVGTFRLPIMAPGDLGDYEEKFKVAVEDIAWVSGSHVTIPIKVTKTPKIENAGEGLSGLILMRSHTEIEAAGGSVVNLRFGIKNVGPKTWKQVKVIEPGVAVAAEVASIFHESGWPEGRVALAMGEREFLPGRLAIVNIPVRMPRDIGSYDLALQLTSENENVGGGLIELPVTVTTPAPEEIAGKELPIIENWRGVAEPRFRVGIANVDDAAQVSVHGIYRVMDGEGVNYGLFDEGIVAEWYYDVDSDTQLIRIGDDLFTTTSYFRLEPVEPLSSYVTIDSLDRRAKWNPAINYNDYRDTLEMRVNKYGYTWLVNELPIESYVKGLAEVSNSWPIEVHKAQVVAARSFAMFYFERGGKHHSSGSQYILNSSSVDQVYKGYTAEQINKNVGAAADATRGQVVQYEGNVAMTTYFARSSGQTRSFSDAWGGRGKPYLVSRPAPYDKAKGNRRWGHGVGMSQTDAAMRADDGANYKEILHSYYTDVTIDRVYE